MMPLKAIDSLYALHACRVALFSALWLVLLAIFKGYIFDPGLVIL